MTKELEKLKERLDKLEKSFEWKILRVLKETIIGEPTGSLVWGKERDMILHELRRFFQR